MTDPARRLSSTLAPALALGALMALGARPALGAEPEDQAKRMIVMVRCKLGGVDTFGAGIIVGTNADRLYIVTANHVVRKGLHEAEDLRVELRSLPGETLEANLLEHVDDELDLAVLNVPGLSERHVSVEGLPFDLLGNAEALERGDPVFHVGNPNGNPWHSNVSPDLVSELLGTEVRFESSFIAPGSSGGGLFDDRWALVGLVRADEPPDGVAVRIDRVLERLEAWGYPVDLTPSPRTGETTTDAGGGTTTGSELPAGAVEGWAIIGSYEGGRFSDLVIDVPGDAPAIGSSYRTVKSFRMVAEQPERDRATITLGIVPVGSTVQVLELDVPPGNGRVYAQARLRAVVEPVQRAPAAPSAAPSEGRASIVLPPPRVRGPGCRSTIAWSPNITFFWEEVEGASSYTVEVDCLGCSGSGGKWYSWATGRPWHVRTGLGRRSPVYGSSVGGSLRDERGTGLRWRVWAVDRNGKDGAKSDWCQVAFSGVR